MKVMLSDFKNAIDEYINEYGDTEIFGVVKHNIPELNKNSVYTLSLSDKAGDLNGIHIKGK